MIKGIIFDCFGVLYTNAQKTFFKKHENLFKEGESFLDRLNIEIDHGRISGSEFFRILERETGISAEIIKKEMDDVIVSDQQLVSLIHSLKRKYKIGLLSNAGEYEIEILYKEKLDELFDHITISCRVGVIKPDPAIFYKCLEGLNLKPEEVLFIDDSKVNVDSSKSLGMKGFIYTDYPAFVDYLNKIKL